jgi:predicted dehydrogenase
VKARLGLIGAGAIGITHAEAAVKGPDVELVAVCDADLGRATDLSGRTGATPYDRVSKMLERERLDGAIVATPPNTHQEIAELAMSRGVHVLCEKPFAPSVDAAQSMIRAAERYGTLITMAAKFRFVPDVRAAREAIASGSLGALLMIENVFTGTVMMANRWNSIPEVAGGGVIMDNGTHAVDLFRFFGGTLEDVSATEYRRYQRLAVEDTAVLFARCKNGAVVSSDLSWSIDKRSAHYLRLFCENATIELGWKRSQIQHQGSSEWELFGNGYSKLDSFIGLQSNFARAITGVEKPEVSVEDALESVIAIDAAYRSLDRRAAAWA